MQRVSVDNLSSLPRYDDTGRQRERLEQRKFSLDSRSTSESGWSDRTRVDARLDRDVRYRGPQRENDRYRSREEPLRSEEKSNEQTQNQDASGHKETQKEDEEEEQL